MKNLLLALLSLATLGLAVLAWTQYRELSELRSGQETSKAESASFEKRLSAAQDNVRELEKQLDELRNGAKAQAAAPSGASAGFGDPSSLSWLPGLASFMDKPEMQRIMTAQQRMMIERRFARLFKQLNLRPEQLQKFKALLLERQTSAMDTFIVGAQKGLNPLQNEAELNKLVSESQSEVDRQIKDLLGESSYSQYDNFVKSEPQRAVVGQLQQSLGYDDEPLTREQSERLTQVLAAPSSDPAKNGRAQGLTEEAINQARTFLSPSQTKALEDLRQQQQQQAELRRTILPQNGSGGRP